MSILIKNGLVLLRDGAGWKTERRHIVIEGNRIAKITRRLPDAGEFRVIDAAGKLVMPGLINAHTHAYMTLLRNCADDLPFFEWLDTVLRYEAGMTQEDVYWGTLLAAVEMIKSGTTCFVDMTIKSAQTKAGRRSAVAGAALESGMRAVISRGLAGVADSEESLTKYGQAVAEMELFADEPLVSFIHGPHAPYSCCADYLRKLTQSAKERGIGQTVHLSESRTEVDACLAEHGMTPIAYVDSLGVFDVPVIAAHCVYATDDDIRIMSEKKVSVALNPKSNCKLGNGFAPAQKFID
ncbi:MAG: amidohydrolase family protein, partial [Clostridia bacterium]|nr:amidohydrolase family protein [Clostridia bacterium]